MKHNHLERADADHTASTTGLWPGIAGVQIERKADVFCNQCARDILGDNLFERLKTENLGYDHPQADELGNVTAVSSSEEWDCPGADCGHCGIKLSVNVIHYPDVCEHTYLHV